MKKRATCTGCSCDHPVRSKRRRCICRDLSNKGAPVSVHAYEARPADEEDGARSLKTYSSAWFDALVTAGSEVLFARACMAPTRKNLEKMRDDLRILRAPYTKGLRAHVEAILGGDLRHEFRYQFGGKATVTVSSYGKVSATSSLFSTVRQAARYNTSVSAWTAPPIKLPRKTYNVRSGPWKSSLHIDVTPLQKRAIDTFRRKNHFWPFLTVAGDIKVCWANCNVALDAETRVLRKPRISK